MADSPSWRPQEWLSSPRSGRALPPPAMVWAAVTVIALITLTSCAGIPPSAILKTPPGDYTITVNSSGNVGAVAEMHTVNVTVTVSSKNNRKANSFLPGKWPRFPMAVARAGLPNPCDILVPAISQHAAVRSSTRPACPPTNSKLSLLKATATPTKSLSRNSATTNFRKKKYSSKL